MFEIIATRRNAALKEKLNIWKMVDLSYVGGEKYIKAGYLFKHPKESKESYTVRTDKSIYMNPVQPLVDIMVGFLFGTPVVRNIPDQIDYIADRASRGKGLDAFMKSLATATILYTCGVLVDVPKFDPLAIRSVKDRQEAKINPYCVIYKPDMIRDFCVDSDGELAWVLLDNTYIDNGDPFEEGVEKKVYRLWTRDYFKDFTITNDNKLEVTAGEDVETGLGEVPFRFVNWRDDNSDFLTESFFEDIAIIARAIYNDMSLMDEMLFSGTFRVLFYPTETGSDLPKNLTTGGVGPLSVIPYPGNYSPPNFDGAKLENVEPFLATIRFYLVEILKKVGMGTDDDKEYVQSGKAKKFDLEKVKSLLRSGIIAMQTTEEWIYSMAGKWEGVEVEGKAVYSDSFLEDDLESKLVKYRELLLLPYEKLKKKVHELLVRNTLAEDVDQKELDEIIDEIKAAKNPEIKVDDLAADERQAREKTKEEGASNEEE